MVFIWSLVLLASFNHAYLSLAASTSLGTNFFRKPVFAHQARASYISKRADNPDAIPQSPPWVSPGAIPYPPRCMLSQDSSTCPFSDAIVRSCTASKCTLTFFGACMQRGDLADKSCFCSSLNANSCQGCSGDAHRAIFLGWLNTTCGDVPGWDGAMPAGWADNTPLSQEMVAVSEISNALSVPDNTYPYANYYDLPPSYGSAGNLVTNSEVWLNNTYNASSIIAVNASFGNDRFPEGKRPRGWNEVFLDLSGFCSSVYQDPPAPLPPQDTAASKAQVLLWAGAICENATSGIHKFPPNWKDSLALGGPGFDRSDTFLAAPKCFNQTACSMSGSQRNCTSDQCLPSVRTTCDITRMIDMPCFCRDLDFRTTCTERCHLSWERAQLLRWLDASCGNVTQWTGLPGNWSSLLQVQEYELIPEKWRKEGRGFIIAPNSNSSSTVLEHHHCPSVASKLGAFAAVNIVMALFIPIVGRRDILKKISLGLCGRRGSMLWMVTGPAAAVLHIAGNAVGAALIKSTPGFSSVNVGQLILLWCTRPRVSWMIIVMVPFQSKDAIYTSVATSTLLAEVILQFLGAYCMVVATNYARMQKFYLHKALVNAYTPRGRDAQLMYAGSVLWLSAIVFAVVVCAWSILGISDFAKAFNNKALTKRAKRAQKKLLETSEQVGRVRENLPNNRLASSRRVLVELRVSSREVQNTLHVLGSQWGKLNEYLTTDFSTLRDTEKGLTRAEKLWDQAKRRQNSSLEAAENEKDEAQADYNTALGLWNTTPKTQLEKVLSPPKKTLTASIWKTLDLERNESPKPPVEYVKSMIKAAKAIEAADSQVNKSHAKLWRTWQEQEKLRAKEIKEASGDNIRLLRIIAWRTIAGMMLCWIAQWLWWTGFIRVMGNNYCPPKLGTVAALWAVFSIFGVMVGGTA